MTAITDARHERRDAPNRSPDIVYEIEDNVRLHRLQADPAHQYPIPVVLVPSLFSRYFVFDLHPKRSMAAFLRDHQFDVWMVDWGKPPHRRPGPGFDEYVGGYLDPALSMIAEQSEAGMVSLLGYSAGGVLSTIYSAWEPSLVRNLITLTTPIDFHKTGVTALWARYYPVDVVVDVIKTIPAWSIQAGFTSSAIPHGRKLWRMFREDIRDNETRPIMNQLRHWISEPLPVAGEVYRNLVKDCYRHNRLVRGDLVVAGRPISLGEIKASLLSIVAAEDHLCPPDSAFALNEAAGTTDETFLAVPGGHLGAVIGRRAEHVLWTRLVDWLAMRSGHEPD